MPDKTTTKAYFLRYAKDNTSQGGEDGIIARIFQLLEDTAVAAGETKRRRYCVDVGAWDGIHLSNTYSLLNTDDVADRWDGLLIEADTERADDCKRLYSSHDGVTVTSAMVQFKGSSSLPSLLFQASAPLDIDLLSIDIDGNDIHIWRSLQASNYRPKVVLIEFNPTIPHAIEFIQEADFRVYQGSSLLSIKELGLEMGYSLICCTIFNAFFLRNDLVSYLSREEDFKMTDINDLERLHTANMVTHMYQLYDGEVSEQ